MEQSTVNKGINVTPMFEHVFGTSKMNRTQLKNLVKALRANPDQEIDMAKLASLSNKVAATNKK